MRGGARPGAGRPPVPEEKKRKKRSFRLTDEEYEIIREYIRKLHKKGIQPKTD